MLVCLNVHVEELEKNRALHRFRASIGSLGEQTATTVYMSHRWLIGRWSTSMQLEGDYDAMSLVVVRMNRPST